MIHAFANAVTLVLLTALVGAGLYAVGTHGSRVADALTRRRVR
jgi:hypothetical protein